MRMQRAALLVSLMLLTTGLVMAQRTPPQMERIGDGTLITVLGPDSIPAINNPVFVSAAEGDQFMADDEPVLGLYDGQVAKAYSLWHLDRHEIVNDTLPNLGPVAVTW